VCDIELNADDEIGAFSELEKEFKKFELIQNNLSWFKSNHRKIFSDEFIANNIHKENFKEVVENEVMKIREEKLKRIKNENS